MTMTPKLCYLLQFCEILEGVFVFVLIYVFFLVFGLLLYSIFAFVSVNALIMFERLRRGGGGHRRCLCHTPSHSVTLRHPLVTHSPVAIITVLYLPFSF